MTGLTVPLHDSVVYQLLTCMSALLVGIVSAIVASVMTNAFAENRHRKDLRLAYLRENMSALTSLYSEFYGNVAVCIFLHDTHQSFNPQKCYELYMKMMAHDREEDSNASVLAAAREVFEHLLRMEKRAEQLDIGSAKAAAQRFTMLATAHVSRMAEQYFRDSHHPYDGEHSFYAVVDDLAKKFNMEGNPVKRE